MSDPWRDPRTGIWKLRKRIPTRYRGVARQKGDTVKITTGTTDAKEARRLWPGILGQWADLEAGWERQLNVVVVTPERAQELAARWAAWIADESPLVTDGTGSDVFEPLIFPDERTPGPVAHMWDVVEKHAHEAVKLSGMAITPESWPILLQAMLPVVDSAYSQADLDHIGVAARLKPLDRVRETLPAVPNMSAATRAPSALPLRDLTDAYAAVASIKPRVLRDTRLMLDMLERFLGHDDAQQITRDDIIRWRDSMKAEGLTNNTWNNRLSMVTQVFKRALSDGKLTANPMDGLRLAKAQGAARFPYSDEDAARILKAARLETTPALRWASWVMAFTGMRVGEVLQLTGGDIQREGDLWRIAVNEDHAEKSVKNGQRRHVPIHPALISEGFVVYAQTVAPDAPVFPDKKLDVFGQRGGRGWNVVGKWVRDKVGITDARLAPNHAWRHRMEDELRAVEAPEDARDAIMGHARKTTGRGYGVRGEALVRLHRYLSKVRSPLEPAN